MKKARVPLILLDSYQKVGREREREYELYTRILYDLPTATLSLCIMWCKLQK